MNPDYARLSVPAALAACEAIIAHATSPSNPYNFDAGTLAAINSVHNTLSSTAEAQRLGALDQVAKTAAKDDALGSVGLVLSSAAKTALASGATEADLHRIGLSRPSRPVRPFALAGPTNLVATGQSDSRIKLAWDRNGNPQGTIFEILGSADGLDYAIVETTTRASLALVGYAPGAACWFKVRAKRSGLASPFSNAASVYAPGGPGGLTVLKGGKAA